MYYKRVRRSLRHRQSHLHWQSDKWLVDQQEPPLHRGGSVTEDDEDDVDDEDAQMDAAAVLAAHQLVTGHVDNPRSDGSSRGSTLRGRRHRRPRASLLSISATTASDAQVTAAGQSSVGAPATVEECGRLGVGALNAVIRHLEEALQRFQQFPDGAGPAADLMAALHALLEQAYSAKERGKQSAILETEHYVPSTDASDESDTDSFVSAAEMLDLSDLGAQLAGADGGLPLYHAALQQLREGGVPCRVLRTELLGLASDAEFLGKLHCLRLAFDELLASAARRDWLSAAGQEVACQMLRRLDADPEPLEEALQALLSSLGDEVGRANMWEELRPRGVKAPNLLDVCLDYMLLDALEALAAPPASLLSVIRNRWLSAGFKRSALASVVWTLVLAKKKLLPQPDGFLARYYDVVATLAPALAWGFLGPADGGGESADYRQACECFKETFLGLVRDLFDFQQARFASVAELSEDAFQLARRRLTALMRQLGGDVSAASVFCGAAGTVTGGGDSSTETIVQ